MTNKNEEQTLLRRQAKLAKKAKLALKKVRKARRTVTVSATVPPPGTRVTVVVETPRPVEKAVEPVAAMSAGHPKADALAFEDSAFFGEYRRPTTNYAAAARRGTRRVR